MTGDQQTITSTIPARESVIVRQTGASVSCFIVLTIFAGGIAYGMFAVGTFDNFEKSKLYLAAAVLGMLSYIFLAALIFYMFAPVRATSSEDRGKDIFDTCSKIIPPLVGLIIGFYFGSSQDKDPTAQSPPTQSAQPEGK